MGTLMPPDNLLALYPGEAPRGGSRNPLRKGAL
jgi:hypothetical protein